MTKTKTKLNIAQVFSKQEIEKVVNFNEDEPYEILGAHLKGKDVIINTYLPRAKDAWIKFNGKKEKLNKIHEKGFYQLILEEKDKIPEYKIGFCDETDYEQEALDPYSVSVDFTDFDLYLSAEGTHYRSYEKFGARVKKINGVAGVQFVLWAPNATAVSVAGNFNHWKAGTHPMSRIHLSGVWGLFIPDLKEDEVYKFAIKTKSGEVIFKADPYATLAEKRPRTASVVSNIDDYKWKDSKWIETRQTTDPLSTPISIYEVHLGSWKRNEKGEFLNYKELTKELIDYVKATGYTHIELLPIMEHPLDASWGYQTVSYYAPTSRFGKPKDFMYFIDQCHQNDIGVILDWVPSHFPKDAHGLNMFDGEQIYAYQDSRRGEHQEWGTLVFDYFKPEIKNFLISNALFWLDKYHVDGLRVDAVASMLYLDYSRKDGEWHPNMHGGREHLEAIDFLKKFNEVIHGSHKGVLTIAEESTAWAGVSKPTYAGGLGFNMKWNMGWMHDTLEYFSKDPVYRKHHQGSLTFSLIYAFSENFVLPISHDEVVYGKKSLLEKMPGDDWQKFANLRLFLGYMYAHPGKKLLFMGSDIAQRDEWNFDKSLDWHLLNYEQHNKTANYLKDLNNLYKEHKALHELDCESSGFEWIDFTDSDACVISFIRYAKDKRDLIVVTCNLTPVPRLGYRIGVPRPGFYKELLNSDAAYYGGSNMGNMGGIDAEEISFHRKPYSIQVNLPPLAINLFKIVNQSTSKAKGKSKKK